MIAFLFLSRSGSISSIVGQSGAFNSPPQGYVVPPTVGNQVAQTSNTLSTVGNAAEQITSNLGIPVVGSIINGLLGTFAAASKRRAQQATSENSAVAQAVPGWDQAVTQIVNAYNNGQLTAAQVGQAIDAIWQNYWSEVGPQIQPGRNGCQSGQVTQPSTVSFCGGTTYGAACCVGYDDLKNSNNNMKFAVQQADNTGKPTPAAILAVFASKYGGINRPAYTVTFIRPS